MCLVSNLFFWGGGLLCAYYVCYNRCFVLLLRCFVGFAMCYDLVCACYAYSYFLLFLHLVIIDVSLLCLALMFGLVVFLM